jgi:PKD repeat protein
MEKFIKYCFSMVIVFNFAGCTPQVDDKIDIGGLPVAAFDVTPTANPNKFTLTNKSTGAFMQKWDLGDGSTSDTSVVTAAYARKGTYKVTLTVFGKGGMAIATQNIVVAQDDPTACTGNVRLLTNCGTKRWKLAPEASALWVGPDATFGTTWWASGAADVTARTCLFNDEYVFSVDGTFQYDSKGDFWADTDANGNIFPPAMAITPGCHPIADMPVALRAWVDPSPRTFIINNTELKVIGLGAYMGLYKVGTGAEVQVPQASVTYTIKELTATRMVLYVSFGAGIWRYTFVSI